MNAVVPLEQAPRLPTMQAGSPVRAIVPQDFEGAWRIASAVCKAGMAPRGLDTPEKAMVAIMHGLEVGLTPMNALQSIAVVNGRPTIWGDGAIGLARASGLLEWMDEQFEGVEGQDTFRAVCIIKRKGEPKPVQGTFSVADAKKAGLWGKQGPWQSYPKRMLQNRARAFILRDTFADVLKGLAIKEEIEDTVREAPPKPPAPEVTQQPQTIDQPSQVIEGEVVADAAEQPVPKPPAPQKAEAAIAKPKKPSPAERPDEWLAWLDAELCAFQDETIEDYWNDTVAPMADQLPPGYGDEALGLYRKHEQRIAG